MTLRGARSLSGCTLLMLAVSFSSRARAESGKAQCIEAYESGQRSRKASALLKAKSEFAHCSSDVCPKAMHDDCSAWLREVNAAIPTGVFHVTDENGAELSGVRVSVDGADVEPLGARALAFDPGEHELTFECEGYRALTRSVTLGEGEQLESQAIVLEALPQARERPLSEPAPPSERPAPAARDERNFVPMLIGLGVGTVGTVGFIAFGLSARKDDRALDSCIPNCSAEQVDSVRQKYFLSNLSLGVAAAGFIGAGISFLLQPSAPGATAVSRANLRLHVGQVSYLTGEF